MLIIGHFLLYLLSLRFMLHHQSHHRGRFERTVDGQTYSYVDRLSFSFRVCLVRKSILLDQSEISICQHSPNAPNFFFFKYVTIKNDHFGRTLSAQNDNGVKRKEEYSCYFCCQHQDEEPKATNITPIYGGMLLPPASAWVHENSHSWQISYKCLPHYQNFFCHSSCSSIPQIQSKRSSDFFLGKRSRV